MRAAFLRSRKRTRGVLVLDGSVSGLEPFLKRKSFLHRGPAAGHHGREL